MEIKQNLLIEIGTPITHLVYGDGKCILKDDQSITVQFDHQVETLSMSDYEYDWIIKTHYNFDLIKQGILDQTTLFENIHIVNIQDEVNEEVDTLVKEINQYKKETELFDQVHLDVLNDTRKKYREIAKRPYFGRIDMQSCEDETVGKTYYIGEYEYKDEIIHWANPIALPYHLPYLYLDKSKPAYLNLKRFFEIKKRQIFKIKDMDLEDVSRPTKEEIEEAFVEALPDIIEEYRQEEIHNIVRSLQNEQFDIISSNKDHNMLVLGVAGSGKTMVLAHRIAYLSYNDEDFSKDDVFVVATSNLTKQELKQIDLDLEDVHFMTSSEFNRYLIKNISKKHQLKVELKEHYLPDSSFERDIIKQVYSRNTISLIDEMYQQIKNKEGKYYPRYTSYCQTRVSILQNTTTNKLVTDAYTKYQDVLSILSQIDYFDLLKYKDELEKEYYSNNHMESAQDEIKQQLIYQHLNRYPVLKSFNVHFVDSLISQYEADLHLIDIIINGINFVLGNKDYNNAKKRYYKVKEDYDALIFKQKQFPFITKNEQSKRYELKKELVELKNKIIEIQSPIQQTLENYGISFKEHNIKELRERLWYIKDSYIKQYEPIIAYASLLHGHVELQQPTQLEDNLSKAILEKYFFVRSLLNEKNYLQSKREIPLEKCINLLMDYKMDIIEFIKSQQLIISSSNASKVSFNQDEEMNISLVVRYIIAQIKADLALVGHGDYELFLTLYILSIDYGKDIVADKYIFIDEVQDYSYLELKTYQNLSRNCRYNYFGDLHQTLTIRGLTKDELMNLTERFKLYSIDYNYRNAKEISDYLSDEFNIDSRNIDLKGHVHQVIDVNQFIQEMNKGLITSSAIIISDASSKSFIKGFEYYPNINIVDEHNLVLKDHKINVIKTSLSKGLEFKNVLVLHHRMSKKERYVASSRALENLYIIK